jgi:DNA-binding NarL/FixJ family response regulator
MTKSRLFLVDDQELILEAISDLIELRGADQGIHVVGTAQNHEKAIAALDNLQPDLVLLDMYMPNISGNETAYVVKQRWPEIKILMLSNLESGADIVKARSAGADGYAFKSGSHQALIEAIMAVLKGDQAFVVPGHLSGAVIGHDISNMGLTQRQRQVLKLLAYGESTKGIASVLKISARTAEKHRAEVMSKLKAPSPVQLVEYAQQLGLPS